MKTLLISAVLAAVSSTTAFAYDTWIVCDPAVVPSGRTISVHITNGRRFPTLATAPDADWVEKAEWRIGTKSGTISTFKADGASLAASGRVSTDGVGVVAVEFSPRVIERTPEKAAAYLEEIGAPASARKAYDEDGKSAGFRETAHIHAKTYVKIGLGGDASGALGPVGFAIDFLPDSDPTALKVGDTLAVKAIRGGMELESSTVGVVCATSGETLMPRTNKAGMVLVKITAPGWWMVRVAQIRHTGTGVWESDFTTMTFYVEK